MFCGFSIFLETKTARVLPRAIRLTVAISCVIGCCVYACYWANVQTADYTWSYMADSLRDLGLAQSILDGRFPEDHVLLGEVQWYNPLMGAMVAAGSWISGLPTHLVDVRIGPYVNLLGPIFFFALAAALFDVWVGLAALFALVFVNAPGGPMWICARYTPWLFATHTTQALFYATLLLYWKARKTDALRWYAAAGVAWGVTFLGHTGWAVLFGCIACVMSIEQFFGEKGKRGKGEKGDETRHSVLSFSPLPLFPFSPSFGFVGIRFALLAGTAFVISLPYIGPILWHYHLHIRNTLPSLFIDVPVKLENLAQSIRERETWPNAIAFIGLIALIATPGKRLERRLILSWFMIACFFLVQSFVSQALGNKIPQFLPAHHFLVMLTAVSAFLFGYGALALAQVAWHILKAIAIEPKTSLRETLAGTHLKWAFAFIVMYYVFKTYHGMYGYECGHQFDMTPDREKAYYWILQNTVPSDVFAADDPSNLFVVAPAGRKLIALNPYYFNVYVGLNPRTDDANRILAAAREGQSEAFRTIAREYHVKYVLIEMAPGLPSVSPSLGGLKEVFRSGPISIYKVSEETAPST